LVSVKFVIGTYGVASAYVLADTYDKASKVSVQVPRSESAQLIAKGQLISEAIFLGFKSPKKETKCFAGFLPLPLKRVESKNKSTLLH
jgi:hypothetical protein